MPRDEKLTTGALVKELQQYDPATGIEDSDHIDLEWLDKLAEEKSGIVDDVIEEIKVDIEKGDASAIEVMLACLPQAALKAYLGWEGLKDK